MKNVKRWLQASFINLIRLTTALIFFNAEALALPPPNLKICNDVFEGIVDKHFSEQRVMEVYYLLQQQNRYDIFSNAADRALFSIAKNENDPVLAAISPQALQEFKAYAATQPSLDTVINSVIATRSLKGEGRTSWLSPDHYDTPSAEEVGAAHLKTMVMRRDNEEWDAMINFYLANKDNWEIKVTQYFQKSTAEYRSYPFLKLQASLAYNRRARIGDRQIAEKMARDVIKQAIQSNCVEIMGEAYGILARIYKDRYAATQLPRYLEKAISIYLQGFEADPDNYYPGIAALDMIWGSTDPRAPEFAESLVPLVQSALEKTVSKGGANYWDFSSQLKLMIWSKQWDKAFSALDHVLEIGSLMSVKSSAQGYDRMKLAWQQAGRATRTDYDNLDRVIAKMKRYVETETNKLSNRPSLSIETIKTFPNSYGAINIKPLVLRDEADRAEIRGDLEARPELVKSISQESIHFLLQKYQSETNVHPGRVFGPTGLYLKAIAALAKRTGNKPWWEDYKNFDPTMNPESTERYMEYVAKTGEPIIFLVPEQFKSKTLGREYAPYSWRDYQWLLNNYRHVNGTIEFVYGAYDLLGIDFYKQVSQEQANGYDARHMDAVIGWLQRRFTELGKNVVW